MTKISGALLTCWITVALGIDQVYSASVFAAVGPIQIAHAPQKNGRSRWLNRRRRRLRRRRALRRALLRRNRMLRAAVVPCDEAVCPLRWPLEKGKFWKSSLFGYRRTDTGVTQFHAGLDLAAPKHTPVRAAADARVIEARYDCGYGNMVLLQHEGGVKTRYGHLNRIKIKVHQRVKAGQLIGTVGATGNVRGNGTDKSHLHFEVIIGGRPRNPLRYLR